MTFPAARKPAAPLARPIIAVGIGSTVLIAVGAFVLSFAALTDLAARSGIDRNLAWIWPIIVDGLIVASTVAIVALAGHDRKTLAYPWALLFLGAVVSTAANAVHAIVSVDQADGGVPPAVSAVMAAMPPVVLLAITHLTVLLVQKAAPATAARKKPAKAASPARVKPAPESTKPEVKALEAAPATAAPAVSKSPVKEPVPAAAVERPVHDRELVTA
ncbi:DUF2637 domain-containing protein [Arthrobacter sp. UYCo732]|uniref:DUF2637 domain-containing protein n=1 Tax=Arthrobacter sp. UYCo732 TaxID=3156336 RepID=UPI0033921B4A